MYQVSHGRSFSVQGQVVADATLGRFDQGPFGFVSAHIAGQSQGPRSRLQCKQTMRHKRSACLNVAVEVHHVSLLNSLLNAIVVQVGSQVKVTEHKGKCDR